MSLKPPTCVGRVVAGEPEVEEVLRDALEVIGGHAELQLSKAEKVNKDKLAQVGPLSPRSPSLLWLAGIRMMMMVLWWDRCIVRSRRCTVGPRSSSSPPSSTTSHDSRTRRVHTLAHSILGLPLEGRRRGHTYQRLCLYGSADVCGRA